MPKELILIALFGGRFFVYVGSIFIFCVGTKEY